MGVGLVGREQRVVPRRLGGRGGDDVLGVDERLEERLRRVEALGHDLLGRCLGAHGDLVHDGLGGLGLDHHDGDVTGLGDPTGDDHREHGVAELGEGREADPLAVDEGDAHAADGAGERQPGELGGQRRRVDRHDVVGVLGVERQDVDDDLDLVAEPVDERRAQRPVDEPAGEDRVGAGAALAAEERAGDLAGGVHALLDVHGQREEVEVALGLLARRRGRQQHGLVVEVGDGGAGGKLGEAAGLEPDRSGAEPAVVYDGLGCVDLCHVVSPFLPPCEACPRSRGSSVVRGCPWAAAAPCRTKGGLRRRPPWRGVSDEGRAGR